jgi:hypothetical protein
METKLKWVSDNLMYGTCVQTKFGVVSIHWDSGQPARAFNSPPPTEKAAPYYYVNYPGTGKGKLRYATELEAKMGAEANLRKWVKALLNELGDGE